MLGRAWLLVALMVGVVFTGCLGEEAPPAVTTDSEDDSLDGELDANDSTVAPDGRGKIAAFQETNRTEMGTGGMEHTHDYWQGSDRLESVAWIDAGLIPIPFLPCKKADNSCTAGGSTPNTDTYPLLTTIADFDMGPGMIYEGTKQVELKMHEYTGPCRNAPTGRVCSEPNPAGKVFFDYLAANDEPGAFRTGGELKFNEPFLIDIQPTDADMPHQTKSLWIFRIYSNTEMVWFDFNISISLVRGYDVVDWPPHPDLYADKAERIVFEGPVKLASKGSLDALLFGSDAGWTAPDKVISWGTDRVELSITNVKFTGTIDAAKPKGFVLEFRNASTPFLMANGVAYGGRLQDPGSDGSAYHFLIDLSTDRGDAMDTPYAQYSRWGFRLAPYWDDTAGMKCIDEAFFPGILFGCNWYPWEMTYDMKIVAYGHSTANAEPPN